MPDPDDGSAADRRARVTIALCALGPVLVGLLATAGARHPAPAPEPRLAGHWVYVPGLAAAVHVDGASKTVDATVAVGLAGAGSPVLQGDRAGYVVDVDRVIEFGPAAGVTGDAPGAGLAEAPVPVETAAAAYLVYRAAGLVARLSPQPASVRAGGPVGDPVADRDGTVWVHRPDTGAVCALGPAGGALACPGTAPAGHRGGLSLLGGRPVLVDVTAGTVRTVGRGGLGAPTRLGGRLPANARVGPADVDGRLPVLDPGGRRLLLVLPGGDTVAVPLGRGRWDRPVTSGTAVALVDQDTGRVTSVDGRGDRLASAVIRTGAIRTTRGEDGRVYADAADGRASVVMDTDGTLTTVRYGGPAATYRPPVPSPRTTTPAPRTNPPNLPPPPTTAAPTTTAPAATTAPPQTRTTGPDRTAGPDPTGGPTGTTGAGPTGGPAVPTRTPAPTPTRTGASTQPAGGTGAPTVDVLAARVSGAGAVTLRLRVDVAGPVFCHVRFNSVERAATACAPELRVTGLSPGTLYDVYVLGTNARGTGPPGRRVQVRVP